MSRRKHEPSNAFWKNVEEQLSLRGANHEWLREKIGKAASTMSNMKNTWPRLDDAMKISEALEVPVSLLYYEKPPNIRPVKRCTEIAEELYALPEEDWQYARLVIDTLYWKYRRAKGLR